jgi:hypothetical protein
MGLASVGPSFKELIMAKVKCYSPLGVEEMKEPVDARECVESCGYTMEPVEPSDPIDEAIQEEVEEENVTEEVPVENKRGRKRKNK